MELTVSVSAKHEYGTYAICMTLPRAFVEVFEPIHTDDDPIICFATRNPQPTAAVVERKKKLREDIAKEMASEIAGALVKQMEKYDTHNGYRR